MIARFELNADVGLIVVQLAREDGAFVVTTAGGWFQAKRVEFGNDEIAACSWFGAEVEAILKLRKAGTL